MFNPLDLFKSVKSAAITIVVIAAVTFTGTVWVQKNIAESKVISLEIAKKKIEDDLFVEQVKVKGLNIVVETLEKTYDRLAQNLQKETEIEKEIDNAAPEDDAPMAPVLNRTLRSVDGMLHHN